MQRPAAEGGDAPFQVVRRGDGDYLFVLVPGDREIAWARLRAVLGVSRRALAAAEWLEEQEPVDDDSFAGMTAGLLRLHADRMETAERERRVLGRFTRAHPAVPIVDVPAMASDVHDLEGLHEIGTRLTS